MDENTNILLFKTSINRDDKSRLSELLDKTRTLQSGR
jgi:hypothetical protein